MSKFVNLQPIWEIATQFIFMIVCKKIFMILAISPPVLPTTTTLNWQFSFSSLKSTKYEIRGTKVSAFLHPVLNNLMEDPFREIVPPGLQKY